MILCGAVDELIVLFANFNCSQLCVPITVEYSLSVIEALLVNVDLNW